MHDPAPDDFSFDDNEDVERLCHEALALFERSDLSEARQLAMEAVALDDEHPFPMFILGLIAEFEGDIPSARDLSELALQSAATNADTIQLRAQVHLREYEFDKAEKLLRFGIVHNPDDAALHEGLARLLMALGRHAEARECAEAALRLDSSNEGAYAVRSASYESSGDHDGLLAALRQSAQLNPDDAFVLAQLAAVEAELGDIPRARALLNRADRLSPRSAHIADLQVALGSIDSSRLLRPLPGLLRWMRSFPGGIVGFLLGFVVMALPLLEVASRSTLHAVTAGTVLAVWGLVGAYAWLGPAALVQRLASGAATAGYQRLMDHLSLPDAETVDPEQVFDLVQVHVLARRRRQAVEILQCVSATTSDPLAQHQMLAIAARLNRPMSRVTFAVTRIPAARRVMMAVAMGIGIAAPLLVSNGTAAIPMYGAGVALALLAAACGISEIRTLRILQTVGFDDAEDTRDESPRLAA